MYKRQTVQSNEDWNRLLDNAVSPVMDVKLSLIHICPFATGGYMNPVADYVTGYKTNHTSIITDNFKLQQDLGMFIKGLTFNGLFSYKMCIRDSTNTSDFSVIISLRSLRLRV